MSAHRQSELLKELRALTTPERDAIIRALLQDTHPATNRLNRSGITKVQNFDIDWGTRTVTFFVHDNPAMAFECHLRLPKPC